MVFRLAMPVLPYRNPKIYQDITGIGPLLREKRVECVLVITDKTLESTGITAPLYAHLKACGIRYAVYDKTCANPTVDNVEEAWQLYRAQECQALIAFGGVHLWIVPRR